MATQTSWSLRLTHAVARQIRERRKEQGMSTQKLAQRCAELGSPISRSVLANLEGSDEEPGRRDTISIAEVLILARALDVPPLMLIFPVGRVDAVEALPGVDLAPVDALLWAEGADTDAGQSVALFREHKSAVDALTRARDAVAVLHRQRDDAYAGRQATVNPQRIEERLPFAEDEVIKARRALDEVRWAIAETGLRLPALPDELATMLNEGGPS